MRSAFVFSEKTCFARRVRILFPLCICTLYRRKELYFYYRAGEKTNINLGRMMMMMQMWRKGCKLVDKVTHTDIIIMFCVDTV